MTAISKNFVTIADTAVDPDSPIDAQLMTGLRDSLIYLREWLGAGYTAGAAQNHNHDGVNSALVPVGPNLLRNGSFEDDTSGWAVTQYTGGTVAISTSNPLHGAKSLSFTSTVLANGGGYAVSNEYLPVAESNEYALNGVVKASVANISCKAEIVWYSSAKGQISITAIYSSADTPTTLTPIGKSVKAPANARWMRVKITGGVPATGSAIGTIYFDGLLACAGSGFVAAAGLNNAGGAGSKVGGSNGTATYVKVGEYRVVRPGVYTTSMDLNVTVSGFAYGRIYKNGVAVGVERSTNLTSPPVNYQEDISFSCGDLAQIYAYTDGGGDAVAYLSLLEASPIIL